MVRPHLLTLVALCGIARQTEEPPSIEQELAQLIEKTNALETIHLVYDLEVPADDEIERGSLEFVYRAPDLMRLRVSSPAGDRDIWVVGERMYGGEQRDDDVADMHWRSATTLAPSVADVLLRKLFPLEAEPAEPGLSFIMTLTRDAESDSARFNWRLGRSVAIFGWLAEMQSRLPEIFVARLSLVWRGDGYRAMVSRETGLFERGEIDSPDGQMTLRLREHHFDEPLDPVLVTLPSEAQDAVIDWDWSRHASMHVDPQSVRRRGFARVDGQLGSGKLSWNEGVCANWRTFLDALHRDWIEARHPGLLAKVEKDADDLAGTVRLQRSLDDSDEQRARIRQEVAPHRTQVLESLDQAEADYTNLIVLLPSESKRSELVEVERELVLDLWNELLRVPSLVVFDEKIEAAFEE